MLKKFKTFESHLKSRNDVERSEFKISHSVKNLEELNKLTEWYDNDQISFLDLAKNNVSIQQVSKTILDPDDYVILIRPTTFNMVKASDVNMSYYKLFKIVGVSDNFPSKYTIISQKDFVKNKSYSTLNLNKLQRGDNIQELVFIKILCDFIDADMDNGIVSEKPNKTWGDQVDYYQEKYPHHIEKMEKQIDKLLTQLGFEWDIVYKDNSNFFINKRAKELFYENEEYRRKKYIFNIDKWNPADFWLIKGDVNKYKKIVNDIKDLEGLNDWLNMCIKNNDGVIGISHKLNKNKNRAWLNKVNVDNKKEPFNHKFLGYELKKTSMNVDIKYEWNNIYNNKTGKGIITIRNYTGGRNKKVSLEIKSNKGHMSGKLTGYLRPLFGDTDFFKLQQEIINSSKEDIIDKIEDFNLEPRIYKDFMDVLNNENNWDYKKMSKLQGLLIIDKILKHPKGSDWVIHEMVNYGRSQTTISAPHYVLK